MLLENLLELVPIDFPLVPCRRHFFPDSFYVTKDRASPEEVRSLRDHSGVGSGGVVSCHTSICAQCASPAAFGAGSCKAGATKAGND